jgi:FkbM family methyltransferase
MVRTVLSPLNAFRRLLFVNPKHEQFERSYERLVSDVQSGSVVVKIPGYGGSFEMDIRSHIFKRLLEFKSYEPEIVQAIVERMTPDKDAIDVGANIGLFTVLFAKTVRSDRRVLAIEPSPAVLSYLRNNIERNGVINRVSIFEGVASNKEGKADLHVIGGMDEYSSLSGIVHSNVRDHKSTAVRVTAKRLDDIVKQSGLRPGIIKLDVEGAEYLALLGAVNMIREFRPIIVSELSDELLKGFGHSSKDVLSFLQQNGYDVQPLTLGVRKIDFPYVGDVLAIPRPL